jgi:hypothetical protein
MPCATDNSREKATTPHSDLAAFFIERNYKTLGCDVWDKRKVQLLCAKLGDTPAMLAARMRIRKSDLDRRMETDCWTKQDGLILTMLEREIDFLKGGSVPAGKLVS